MPRDRFIAENWQRNVSDTYSHMLRWCLHTCDRVRCGRTAPPPFALWHGRASFLDKIYLPSMQSGDERFFFLVPYGLRVYALVIGLIYFLTLIFWGLIWQAFLAIFFIVLLTPMLLFYFLRISVLRDVHKPLAANLEELSEIVDAISLKSQDLNMLRFAWYECLPLSSERASIAWRSSGSWPQAFIVHAYLEFFDDSPEVGPVRDGTARFFIFHLWPLWSSFVVLLGLMLFTECLSGMQLVWLSYFWLMSAIVFSILQIDESARWMAMTREDMNRAFPWKRSAYRFRPGGFSELRNRSLKLGIGLALTVVTGALLATIKIYAG